MNGVVSDLLRGWNRLGQLVGSCSFVIGGYIALSGTDVVLARLTRHYRDFHDRFRESR